MSIELSTHPVAKPEYTDGNTGEDVYVEHKTYRSIEYRVPAGTVVRRGARLHARSISSGDPRHVFPNIEVSDECLILPIMDIADFIVARSPPEHLARALWQNDDVRVRFVAALCEQWSSDGIDDKDRRSVLTRMQQAVYGQSVDDAVRRFVESEMRVADQFAFWQEASRINDVLDSLGVKVSRSVQRDDGTWDTELVPLRFETRVRPDVTGKEWHEARDFWRAQVAALIPPPELPAAKDASDVF